MSEFPQPFWNTPAVEADVVLDDSGLLVVGEVPDPEKFRAAGWTISADGRVLTPPPNRAQPTPQPRVSHRVQGREQACSWQPWDTPDNVEHECKRSPHDGTVHECWCGQQCHDMGTGSVTVPLSMLTDQDRRHLGID